MSEGVTTLYARPGMYLSSYGKSHDAASLYLNFLTGVFFDSKVGYPQTVDIGSTGQVFTVSAVGYTLPVTNTQWVALSDLFDVHQYQIHNQPYSGLELLRPMVWFSEYCLISCTTPFGNYRQTFLQGVPLAPARYSDAATAINASLSFSFTLPPDIFERTLLAVNDLKSAISIWQKREFVQQTSNVSLALDWYEQSEYHHSLHITVQ